ncbi:MAG: hypothetical protein WD534_00065 [Phycisphaeraceae bacterium]
MATSTRTVLLGLVTAGALLSVLPWLVTDPQTRAQLYAEEAGLFEQASIALWVLLAAGLFFILRPATRNVAAAAVTCLFAAAREASWHKRFTDGESVLKLSYYLDGHAPLAEQLLIAAITVVGIFCLGMTALTVLRHTRAHRWLRAGWVQLFLVFFVVGVVSKVFDRTPAILDDSFGVTLPSLLLEMMQSCEEGLEMLLPVMLAITAIAFARHRTMRRRLAEP